MNITQPPQAEDLPPNTWATMVHKKFQDRYVDFLYQNGCNANDHKSTVTLLDDPDESGAAGRRYSGYHVILTSYVRKAPLAPQLSAFCRQNISWTARMQHRLLVPIAEDAEDSSTSSRKDYTDKLSSCLPILSRVLCKTLVANGRFLLDKDKLRVDVYPRSLLEPLCGLLQQQAVQSGGGDALLENNDPFDGPLNMTASRSQCTVRLTVVVVLPAEKDKTQPNDASVNNNHNHATSTAASSCHCYWGFDQRPVDSEIMDLPLNHEAHSELNILPMRPTDGSDDSATPVPPTTPLCRAHFKLRQVWHDVLQNRQWHENQLSSTNTTNLSPFQGKTGLDVGASPGGWTQVLLHEFQLSHVYAIDPALVAQRVTQYNESPRVTHATCMLDQFSTWLQHSNNSRPHQSSPLSISVVVCDACILWQDLLRDLAAHILPHINWQYPAVMILTCKLPFATPGSIARQVKGVQDAVPTWLETHVRRQSSGSTGNGGTPVMSSDVKVEWQLLHLFANSESERTLVVTMEQPTATGGETPPTGKRSSQLDTAAAATSTNINNNSSTSSKRTRLDRSLRILYDNSTTSLTAENTPSRREGIDAATERLYRLYGASLIHHAAELLENSTNVTACIIFQRLYHRVSLGEMDVWAAAMGSLFCASKTHEVSLSARQIIVVFAHLYKRRRRLVISGDEDGSLAAKIEQHRCVVVSSKKNNMPWTQARAVEPILPSGPIWKQWFDTLVQAEGQILRALGFMLYWIPTSHAHAFLDGFIRALELQGDVALCQRAWNGCNDAYRLDLCVRFEASLISVAAILASLRPSSSSPKLQGAWWIPLVGHGQEPTLADCANLLLSLQVLEENGRVADAVVAETAFLNPLAQSSFNGPGSFLWEMEEGNLG